MYLVSVQAYILWSLCWYTGHSQPVSGSMYCEAGHMGFLHFGNDDVGLMLMGPKSSFAVPSTTYTIDNKTGFITFDAPALREDAYRSYPFVKHLWNLTYDKVEDQILLNHPNAKGPIPFAKEYCEVGSDSTHHLRRLTESGNLTNKIFCNSSDQGRKGVHARFGFDHGNIPFQAFMKAQQGALSLYDDYELRDGPSDDLKLVWSETINNHTTVDVIPFMEFSTRIYYNTKLDKLNVSSTSSKDFWVFEPHSSCTI
ncbi:hypothetical protein FOL47_009624 [Perkinsus chesapeaki]|uniref:Uncharacterized protein n=1 Tax=Perkinsus chesapeaki TaxID=330153 RepID=A0A7J6L7A0_PERCH|nr:hypothetical protein FOL47_009624 [Perkinsus chesapeaki]